MFPECSCMRPCVSPEQALLARYVGYLFTEFDQTSPLMDFGARMKTSNFGGKRSRVKVTVGSNTAQNAHSDLLVVTCCIVTLPWTLVGSLQYSPRYRAGLRGPTSEAGESRGWKGRRSPEKKFATALLCFITYWLLAYYVPL